MHIFIFNVQHLSIFILLICALVECVVSIAVEKK